MTTTRTADPERLATELLSELEVPTYVRGYVLVRDAVVACLENLNLVYTITKGLYPLVAEKNGTEASRVERNIRHLIDLTWKNGNKDELIKLFGPATYRRGVPTNSFFITKLAETVRYRMKYTSH